MIARARGFALLLALLPAAALALAVSCPGEARAQDDPVATAEARKRFLEGVKLFDEKKYELSRAAFLQAYALKKHPDVLLNLAQSELMSNHAFDAVGHFKEFLKDPATSSHPRRGDAERGLADARSRIGRVQVNVNVSDADVLVDGKKVGTSPLGEPLDLPSGQHSIEVRKGGKSDSKTVTLPEGKLTPVALQLGSGPPLVVPPPPPDKDPPAPVATSKPPPPRDTLRSPESDKLTTDYPTTTGGREGFFTWLGHSPIGYVGAGLAVVGLGVGVGFLVAGNGAGGNVNSLADQIRQHAQNDAGLDASNQPDGHDRRGNPCAPPVAVGSNGVSYATACSNLQSNIDTQNTDKTLSTVGFAAFGVGAVVLVGGYLLTAPSAGGTARNAAPPPSFVLAPVLSPTLAGLGAGGRF